MLKKFLSDRSGNFAIALSVLSMPILLSVGFGVDYSRLLAAHNRLQGIADTAALALAASSEKDQAKLEQMAKDFIAGNIDAPQFKEIRIASLNTDDNAIDIDLTSEIDTLFMGLANHSTLDVDASALAQRAVVGSVEVALVLDNTESMNYDGKIGTLKTAATNLVTQLTSNKDADVSIALVPYAEQINVGMENRNASWISVPDDYSNSVTTTKTTTTPAGCTQKTKKATPNVCLVTKAAYSKTVEKDGVMVTTDYPASCTSWQMVNDGAPVCVEEKTTTSTSTTTTTYKWFGCVGSRVSGGKLLLDETLPTVKYPGLLGKNNAWRCLTSIVPLTKEASTIKTAITGMITSRTNPTYTPNTYIPGGLMWGINVLSISEPFTQAKAYDPNNIVPRKVIVLMTDGLNTMRVNTTGALNTEYLKDKAYIGDTTAASAGAQRTAVNTDTTTLCNYAKHEDRNIEIFTVAFKVDDAAVKTMLQGCATDAQHYYDASDPDKLLAAFSGIAQSLSQVRLAR